jgi:hypothetical protein
MSLNKNTIEDFIQVQTLIKGNGGFYQAGEKRVTFPKLACALDDAALQFGIHLPDAFFRLTLEKNSLLVRSARKADGPDPLRSSCATDTQHS